MSVPFQTRGVACNLLALLLLGATPIFTLAAAFQSPCAAQHHQCDAPSIGHCCCLESTGSSAPATTESGPERLSPPSMLSQAAALACGLAVVFPPDAWLRECTRSARPPLPLHLLNVSILL